MNNTTSFCLLVVEKDEFIINRLTAAIGATCSIIRFSHAKDTRAWLITRPTIDLIITDEMNGTGVTTIVRTMPVYRSVPVLSACRSVNTHLVKTALAAGVTDILAVLEDDHSLQTKMNYYLELKKRVLSVQPDKYRPTVTVLKFSLPWWKRFTDIAVSFTVLLLASPLLLLTALLIVLDSKGPILYKSKRAGTNFRVFNMYKFRTMKVQADKLIGKLSAQNMYAKPVTELNDTADFLCADCQLKGVSCQQLLFDQTQSICEKLYLRESEEAATFMKFRNDPRITRIGTFLRNSSIDELPQLFNVLLGDMSLVGNRPLPLYEAEKLTSDDSAQRFAGPAGLTGIWQVKKRAKGQGLMSDRERILLDIEYANTFSFKTDTYIMWRTIFSLWQKENV